MIERAEQFDGDCSVVYVGDSVMDLYALLAADVGLIVGSSAHLLGVCDMHGITVLPFLDALGTVADANPVAVMSDDKNSTSENSRSSNAPVLYAVQSWRSLGAALAG